MFSSFCSKTDDVTNRLSTKINHKINKSSGNIGVMLLKLGTRNVPQVRRKMTPTVLLLWQQFCFRFNFMFVFVLIRHCLLPMSWWGDVKQYGHFVRFKWVCLPLLIWSNGYIWFLAERDWSQEKYHTNVKMSVTRISFFSVYACVIPE